MQSAGDSWARLAGFWRRHLYASSYKHSVMSAPMASRKEQKEQARAARIAQQQATAAQAQRTRRIQIFGGAIAIAVIVIVVAIVVSSGGSNTPKNTSTGLATGTKLVSIKNRSTTRSRDDPAERHDPRQSQGPVTMQYFGDLECPICQAFTLTGLPDLRAAGGQDRPRQGRVPLDVHGDLRRQARREPAAGPVQLAAGGRLRRRASRTSSGITPSSSTTSREVRAPATPTTPT